MNDHDEAGPIEGLDDFLDDVIAAAATITPKASTPDAPNWQNEAQREAVLTLFDATNGEALRAEPVRPEIKIVKGRRKIVAAPVSPQGPVFHLGPNVMPIEGLSRGEPRAPRLDMTAQLPLADVEAKLAGIFAAAGSPFAEAYPDGRDWRISEKDNAPAARRLVGEIRAKARRARYSETENGREKIKAQKARRFDRSYHRPFVAIDLEGMEYPGDDIQYAGATYPKHRAFLAGAMGWRRNLDAIALKGLAESDPDVHAKALRDGAPIMLENGQEADWLGDETRRPLTSVEMFDWLLSLPDKFGDANFVMFSFNYDVTQILADLPYKTVREICRQKLYDEETNKDGDDIGMSPVFYGQYAISYIKSKVFKLWLLRDPDKPYVEDLDANGKVKIDKETGKPKMKIDAAKAITIYDTFGFYQKGFVEVSKSLVDNGYMSAADFQIIKAQKASRAQFNQTDFETIKRYCGLELIGLSKALTVLRDGFDRMGLRLRAWSGAGSAASALFRKEGLKANHFPEDVSATEPPPWQKAAVHAYFGGNIQLIKQGYAPQKPLFGYDLASAYPSATLMLPSMKGGTWTTAKEPMLLSHNASARAVIEGANVLSMFRVRWRLPQHPYPIYDRKRHKWTDQRPYPFFPLPYRTKTGAILYPSEGVGWIMRDELLGAIAWFKTFFPDREAMRWFDEFGGILLVEAAMLFEPAADRADVRPFAFVQEQYDLRSRTPKKDVLNQAIKLCLNSLYGKLAQSVGEKGKVPPSACPYYAAAITANCRMRLMLAALNDPHAIVMFATDGIVSTRELKGLERVRDTDAGEKAALGDWEMNRLGGGMYLQSGLYVNFKPDGEAKDVKTRGVNSANVAFGKQKGMRAFLESRVLPQWRKVLDTETADAAPSLTIPLRTYITAGGAIASRVRFRLIGRWAETERAIDIHTIGVKRDFMDFEKAGYRAAFYFSHGALPGAGLIS
jgi:hypothetical protein